MAGPKPPNKIRPLNASGLTPVVNDNQRTQARDTIRQNVRLELQRLADYLGRLPTPHEIGRLCRFTLDTITYYFDTLDAALSELRVSPPPTASTPDAAAKLKRVETGKSHIAPTPLPRNVAAHVNFRQLVLVHSRQKGLFPSNPVEEATVFQWMGVGKEYLRRYPLTHDDVVRVVEESGDTIMRQLLRMHTHLQGGPDWRRTDQHSTLQPTLAYRLDETGRITQLDFTTDRDSMMPNPDRYFSVVRDHEHRVFRPIRYDPRSQDLVQAWFAYRDVQLSSLLDQLVARRALKGLPVSGDEGLRFSHLEEALATGGMAAVIRWIGIWGRVHPEMQHATRIDFSVSVNVTRGEMSGLELTPLTPRAPWKTPQDGKAHMLLEQVEGRWALRQYKGPAAERLATPLKPKGVGPIVIGGHGNVDLSWTELKAVMRDPKWREDLFRVLWSQKNPPHTFPTQFIFQASKKGKDGTRTANNMTIFDVTMPVKHQRDLVWLTFDRTHFESMLGRGAQELAKEVLLGNGITWSHPLEYALIMRELTEKVVTYSDEPLREADVMAYFKHHGRDAMPRILDLMHTVNPELPKRPRKVALSGSVDTHTRDITTAAVWYDDQVDRTATDKHYFWVEFERVAEDEYQVTYTRRRTGSHIAGQIIAPDAEEMERQRQAVAETEGQGYGSTEPVCKPEPMITPADLKKTPPLVTVPVPLKEGNPGFNPSPLEWKHLETPPTDTIPILSHTGTTVENKAVLCLELLMAGILFYLTRGAPLPSPAMGGGVGAFEMTDRYYPDGA